MDYDFNKKKTNKQDGWMALIYASKNGKTDTVELLLKHGANINHQDEVQLI